MFVNIITWTFSSREKFNHWIIQIIVSMTVSFWRWFMHAHRLNVKAAFNIYQLFLIVRIKIFMNSRNCMYILMFHKNSCFRRSILQNIHEYVIGWPIRFKELNSRNLELQTFELAVSYVGSGACSGEALEKLMGRRGAVIFCLICYWRRKQNETEINPTSKLFHKDK